MLAALPATALAAPIVVEPLLEDGSGFFDAEFLPLPDGALAISVQPGSRRGGSVVFLPDAKARVWTAATVPGGTMAAAGDGLHAVVAWADPLLGGRHWRLEGERFVAQPRLPTPPDISGVQAVAVDGERIRVWGLQGGATRLHTATPDGWTTEARTAARAFDDEGEVYIETERAVRRGSRRWQAPPFPPNPVRVFDESPDGRPLFVTVEEGRLRTWWDAAVHDHPLPRTEMPDPAGCLKANCAAQLVGHTLPNGGRLAFDARGPVVPFVQMVQAGTRTCVAYEQHPCDPAGPINTCPKGPRYECEGPRGPQEHTLFLQRRDASGWTTKPIDLPFEPLRVLDTAVVENATWMLVESGIPGGARTLHRVRLDDTGPAWDVRQPAPDVDSTFGLDALLDAGLLVGQGTSAYTPPPAWGESTVQTGGETAGPAWVEQLLPDAAGATIRVTADIDPWHDGCGLPELAVAWGPRRWSLQLGAEPARLQVGSDRPILLEAPGHGAHTWALSATEDGVRVEVDGEVVHEVGMGPSPEGPAWATAGQRTSCGRPVGPAVTWQNVAISGGSVL